LQTAWFHQQSDTFSWRTGIDLEYTAADLTQTQVAEVPWSDVFPVGKQYDYAVDSVSSAVFANIDWQATQTTLVNAGLRFNSIWYDYDNRMINGSSTEDGSSCAGGPCRYSRPADRDDSFNNWSFDLGVTQDISRSLSLVGTLKQGFRPPQSTELYRLQAGQEVADIQSEEMQSVEAGLRGSFAQASFSLVGFAMRKDNVIFADAQRRNVSDGKTEHWGLEYSANWQLLDDWTLQLNGTYARHYYANNAVPNGVAANSDIEGNDIDTAPRHMGSLKVQWAFHSRGRAELEWLHMGEYYLEPENLYTYAGHNLLNLRTRYQFTDSIAAGFRVTNLANVDYAERADYAFGEYRYFVGEPRSLYADISFSF
jgi:outer membrane receptor protein involved in Fe transport